MSLCCRVQTGFAIIMLVITKSSMTSTQDGLAATIALFLTYSGCNAACTYCLSFLFKSASGAQRAMILMNAVSICLVLLSFVVGRNREVCNIDANLNYLFMLLPHYAWGNGLLKVRSVLCSFFTVFLKAFCAKNR